MNARKLSNFLQSMERSCDLYSGSALQERQKLMEVDTQYKELDKTVHRTLNVVPRKTAPPTRPQTQKSRARTASRMRGADSDSQQLVVRPAPYPVKNYILPEFGHRTTMTENDLKQFIVRKYDEGKSMTKIAMSLKVNKSTVSRTIARGRNRLYHYLQYSL